MKQRLALKNVSLEYPLINFDEKKIVTTNLFSFHKKKKNKIVALKNINLNAFDEERIGICGDNGSGKSTLLKVISKIYDPTIGEIEIDGEISVMLDTNCGMEKDATGFENIYLYSYARGIPKEEIDKTIDFVKEFSELGNSLNFPLRTYSTGMITRLTTSILLAQQPEIFVSDEFFLTGDKKYVDKMYTQMNNILSKTKLFIFASHNIDLIKKICNRIITLKNGEIIEDIKI